MQLKNKLNHKAEFHCLPRQIYDNNNLYYINYITTYNTIIIPTIPQV